MFVFSVPCIGLHCVIVVLSCYTNLRFFVSTTCHRIISPCTTYEKQLFGDNFRQDIANFGGLVYVVGAIWVLLSY